MKNLPTDGHLIYVVDDETDIRRLITIYVSVSGFQVKGFSNGAEALCSFKTDEPDLIILDLTMPGANGLEVAREIRRTSQVPILMLTVREEIATKVTAFDVGIDDYLTKPFQIEELLARIRAILRRTTPAMLDSPRVPYYSGSLFVDIENMHITSHGRRIQLTPREWGVLRVLIKYAGRMVSSRQLLQEAWGQDYGDEADYVRTYVTRLRKKLEPDPQNPQYIQLERGLGYRMVEPG